MTRVLVDQFQQIAKSKNDTYVLLSEGRKACAGEAI